MSVDPDRPRVLRRRHMHERQAVVFGVLLAGLALTGLGAVAVFTGALEVPGLARGFSSPSPEAGSALLVPCPPAGAAPVPYAQITVSVFNGSTRSGLAAETSADLVARGFVIGETKNAPERLDDAARVTFGVAGVAAGYTLAAQLEEPLMVLDNRADASVELVVGEAYSGLLSTDVIALDPAVPFAAPAGCVPIEQIELAPLPAPTDPAIVGEEPTEEPTEEAPPAG